MTSTLLISAFDIPQAAVSIVPTNAFDGDLNQYNTIGGNRYLYGQLETAAASSTLVYSLPTGTTKAVDHLIVARADILKTAGATTFTLSRSSDGSAYTTAQTDAGIATATLYGPRSDDYIIEIATTSAYQYWKLALSGSSHKYCFSKASFGTFLDLGKNVDSYSIDRIPANEATWKSDSRAEYFSRVSDELYEFTFRWVALTSAKVQTFFDTIVRYKHIRPIFLYTPATNAQHQLLDNQRLIHCMCTNATRQVEQGQYEMLTATFREILG